ncbi:MAG TPA: tetratricopeptide repeat protein [Rudaea sp.]|nr:tetratricopeptide repeat protein [Rudaea sp.]
MSLITELRQRKLVQWALAYAAAAFALLQGIDIVAQRFGWPESIERILIVVLCVGFFITLLLAWYHGERGVQKVSGTELLLLALLLGIGGGLLWKFAPATGPESSAASRAPARPAAGGENDSGTVTARAPASDKSIAVLPFENLSDDKANAYFASGMQDEILTKLSKIAALHVVSRTSTQRYASTPDNLSEIARQLGVANILEGSVQRAGNAVHINVQLIHAATDEHVWAESYNRTLDDVFGVQGEVAQAVAEALKASLTGAERQVVAAKGTENPKAYDAYLRGRVLDQNAYARIGTTRALDNYLEAVHEDPDFAQAWAAAAVAMAQLYFNGFDAVRSTEQAVRDAADKALALQPELAESVLARGGYLYWVKRDYPGALEQFKRALAKQPGDIDTLAAMFFIERRMGLWNDAVAHYRDIIARDPRNVSILVQGACEIPSLLRRYDEARQLLERAMTIAPDDTTAPSCLTLIEQRLGKLDAADAWLARVPKDSLDFYEGWARIHQLVYRRRHDELGALLVPAVQSEDAALTNVDLTGLVRLAYAQRLGGNDALARQTFERLARAITSRPGGIEHISSVASIAPLVYAGLGDHAKAIATAQREVEANRHDKLESAASKIVLAQVQAQKGDRDAAIALLPELLEIPAGLTPALLTLDPLWDPIRDDPRFIALTKQPLTEYKVPPHG